MHDLRPSFRKSLIGALALALAATLPSTAAAASKTDLCHATGNGRYKPLNVSNNAVPAHLNHGDVLQPNGAVPGSPGSVFDSSCNFVTWSYAFNTTPDTSAQDPGSAGNLWVGSGIPATNFATATNAVAGIELGLMVHYRQGPTIASADNFADEVLNVSVASGPQSMANGSSANSPAHAAWNYVFSIATGLGSAATNINDFTFQLLVDLDPGLGTSYRTFVLEPLGTPPLVPGLPPPPAQPSGFQWRDQASGFLVMGDDEGVSPTVTQNSQNYTFYSAVPPLSGSAYVAPGFAGPAKFDLILQAFDGAQLIASNHIVVNVAP